MSRAAYLGLGSNVGDREGHLRAAVAALRAHGVEVEAISSIYETEPVGEVLDQPDFLNAAVRVRTDPGARGAARPVQGDRGRAGADARAASDTVRGRWTSTCCWSATSSFGPSA